MEIMPGFGPASTPQAAALGEAQVRVLHALARAADAGHVPTVGRVAEIIGSHPNGVRRHLEAMAAQGLVAMPARVPGGRGRPSVAYDLTPTGRAALAGAAAPISAEYLAMASAFAGYLVDRSETPAEEAVAIGRSWGRELAVREADGAAAHEPAAAGAAAHEPEADGAAVPEAGGGPVPERTVGGGPAARVVRLLEGLGFSPLRRGDGPLALRTCPLLEAARDNPEVLCQVHLGLVRGASAAYGGPADGGALEAFAEPGACVLHLP